MSGLVRPECAIADVLAATFPCGSVTGAPKIAAMRIIDQLENSPRGAYTGSLLVAVPGSLDSSVLIRTLEGRGRQVRVRHRLRDHRGLRSRRGVGGERAQDRAAFSAQCPPMALRETCRVVAGSIPLWTYHRERLRRGGCGEQLLAEIERAALSAAAVVAAGACAGELDCRLS